MLPRLSDAQMADIAPIGKGVAQWSPQDHTGDMVVVTGATLAFAATITELAALRITQSAFLKPDNVSDCG